ncbi:MAG TPA: 30S ribosome-binding factor RbfA [Bacteroidales bacterium]|nr:30S ribosome-binding factor RbfA [Bacteroidales bacterium]
MQSNRLKKIERLLQKDLGSILQMEGRSWFPGTMVTVTKVTVSPDLGIAKIFVSIYGKSPDVALQQLELRVKEIRRILGMQVKNQLRVIPDLRFFVDDSLDYIENIEKLLKT